MVAPRCLITGNRDLRYSYGEEPEDDAWLTNFFIENHLAYEIFPEKVASPEQLNFIVYMDGEPFYYPCPDRLFADILQKKAGVILNREYQKYFDRVVALVEELIDDDFKRDYLNSLLFLKFERESSIRVLLPGRMVKRLLTVFITISEIPRPLGGRKDLYNKRAEVFFHGSYCQKFLDATEGVALSDSGSLIELNHRLDMLYLQRLFLAATLREVWVDGNEPDDETLKNVLYKSLAESNEWQWFSDWFKRIEQQNRQPAILWMGSANGEIVVDLLIIRQLIRMGVKVILSVKHGFLFDKVSFSDLRDCHVLDSLLKDADFIEEQNISKNELLYRLHGASSGLLVISDGTRESFNPLLTSVTFARSFKEVDLVINRCGESVACLKNHFQFTRNLLSIVSDGCGELDLFFKPRHPGALRFSEAELRARADKLIEMVETEKEKGKKCLFYSAIVGSIPGQLEVAKKILNVFVDYLRNNMDDVVIINPGEHFEEGMDADDIMYMWEIFQRSGVIDIWRFQTVEDIEKSFQLMGEKVPPEWTGKDATFSTGCTKEMKIAREVQKDNPEMQLIGPSWERFKRRQEYGVGKLYDRALAGD